MPETLAESPPDSRPAPPPQEPVIKCAALTKVFKDFWLRNRVRAVENVDLAVEPGEIFGLLGPNGSGKSTTIKLMLGLLRPTSGRVFVYGRRPEDVKTKREIGYLPEESYLYRFLNARETLDYYGRLFGQGRRQRRQRIDMLLEMVGLTAVQRRPIGEYSKGMQRRIGLAQALINDPKLLILDEPTTGLDPIGTRQIKDLIKELGERGKTVLLCSHLLGDVEDVCDRVAIMFGGRIRQEGRVGQLLAAEDLCHLETDELDDETVRAIEELLEKRGHHIHRMDRPRRRLESLFLEIVEQAQAEGQKTSGAIAGGAIASFLGSEAEGGAAGGEAVIEALVTGEAASSGAPAAGAGEAARPPAEAAPGPEKEVLEALVAGREGGGGGGEGVGESSGGEAASGAASSEAEVPAGEKPEVDRSVIDSLVDRPSEEKEEAPDPKRESP